MRRMPFCCIILTVVIINWLPCCENKMYGGRIHDIIEIVRYDSSLYSFSVLDPVSAKIKKYSFITESVKVFVDVPASQSMWAYYFTYSGSDKADFSVSRARCLEIHVCSSKDIIDENKI